MKKDKTNKYQNPQVKKNPEESESQRYKSSIKCQSSNSIKFLIKYELCISWPCLGVVPCLWPPNHKTITGNQGQ